MSRFCCKIVSGVVELDGEWGNWTNVLHFESLEHVIVTNDKVELHHHFTFFQTINSQVDGIACNIGHLMLISLIISLFLNSVAVSISPRSVSLLIAC